MQPVWITLSHSLSGSPLPWAITSKLTWSLLIQITLTMHANGNHVSPQKLHKNALAQIPMTLLQSEIYSRAQTAQRLSECFFREFRFSVSTKFNNQDATPHSRLAFGVRRRHARLNFREFLQKISIFFLYQKNPQNKQTKPKKNRKYARSEKSEAGYVILLQKIWAVHGFEWQRKMALDGGQLGLKTKPNMAPRKEKLTGK